MRKKTKQCDRRLEETNQDSLSIRRGVQKRRERASTGIGMERPFLKETKRKRNQEQQYSGKQSHHNYPGDSQINSFTILTQLEGSSALTDILLQSEISKALNQFNIQSNFSEQEFGNFLVRAIDLCCLHFHSTAFLLEGILKGTSKDIVLKYSTKTCSVVIQRLLSFIHFDQNQNQEGIIRFLGFMCFEIPSLSQIDMLKVYHAIQEFGFAQSLRIPFDEKRRRLSLNCITNILSKHVQTTSPIVFDRESMLKIFNQLVLLFEQMMGMINVRRKTYLRCLTTVIRAINFSLSELKQLEELTVARLFSGLFKVQFIDTQFQETVLSQEMESENKVAFEEQKKERTISTDVSDHHSSDDQDSFNTSYTLCDQDIVYKIKIHSLATLQTLFKISGREVFNYWHCMFPNFLTKPIKENSPLDEGNQFALRDFCDWSDTYLLSEPSLLYLIHAENNVQLKQAKLNTLSILLEYSPLLKCQFEQTQQNSSYPLSKRINLLVRFLHYTMFYWLHVEKDTDVLSIQFKTLASLISATPYHSLKPGLLSQVMQPYLLNWMYSSKTKSLYAGDIQVKFNLLNALSAAFNSSHSINELTQLMNVVELNSTIGKNLILFMTQTEMTGGRRRSSFQDWRVSIENLQLISKIAKNYPHIIIQEWHSCIKGFLSFIMEYGDKKQILNGLKIIEEFLKNYQDLEGNEEEDDISPCRLFNNETSPLELEGFNEYLMEIFMRFLKSNESPDISTQILNILATFSGKQWDLVDEKTTHLIIQIAYEFKSTQLLKAGSVKLYGYLIYKPKFQNNAYFVEKLIDKILSSQNDHAVNVSIRNSWTLANVCCVLIEKLKIDRTTLTNLLIPIINYNYANKEKMISNSIRALGYIFQNIPYLQLRENVEEGLMIKKNELHQTFLEGLHDSQYITVDDILRMLISKINHKSPKVSWNACVSVGNIIKNSTDQSEINVLSSEAILPLTQVVINQENYKTRIHATHALSRFTKLDQYGDHVYRVWDCILFSMKQVSQVSDFAEYKYVETLEGNLMELMSHLTELLDNSEEGPRMMSKYLTDNIEEIYEMFVQYLSKVKQCASLYVTLTRLQSIIDKWASTCVPFFIIENIQMLAETQKFN